MRFFKTALFLIKWGFLICAVAGAILAVYLYLQLNDQIRLRAVAELNELFPELDVTLSYAELSESQGVVFRNLIFSEPPKDGQNRRNVLVIDEVAIQCSISLKQILQKDVRIQSIVLTHPQLYLSRDAEGKIREGGLFRRSRIDKHRFSVSVQQGVAYLEGAEFRGIDALLTRSIVQPQNADLSPPENVDTSQEPQIPQFSQFQESWESQPALKEQRVFEYWSIQGSANADWCRELRFEGNIDLKNGDWEISGSLQQIQCCEGMWDFALAFKKPDKENAAPGHSSPSSPKFDLEALIRSVRGLGQASFQFSHDDSEPLGFRGHFEGTLTEGRAHVDFLKRPLSDLQLRYYLDQGKIHISECSALNGDAHVFLEYVQNHLTNTEGAILKIGTENMLVNKDLIGRLSRFAPAALNELLEKFHNLSLFADTEITLIREKGRWIPHKARAEGTELSFLYADSPYQVEGLAGQLDLDANGVVSFLFATPEPFQERPMFSERPFSALGSIGNLDRSVPGNSRKTESAPREPAKTDSLLRKDIRRINIEGRFKETLTTPFGEIVIRASGVPIDYKLINTIPEKQRHVIRSLHPEGQLSACITLAIPRDKTKGIGKKFVIGVENCSICYDRFPYPVHGIQGTIEWDGVKWLFHDFSGSNESTKVSAKGELKYSSPDFPGGFVLSLIFYVSDLPLEGRLREALINPGYKELYDSLRGTGKVNVNAQVRYFPAINRLNVMFDAEPEKTHGITICPVRFPLKIENVHGKVRFYDGNFSVKNMRGRNKDSTFTSNVNCNFNKDGSWEMDLSPIVVDQIPPRDNDFLRALPENFQMLVKHMNPEGPINLNGRIRISKPKFDAPLSSIWNFSLTLHQNAIDIGIPVRNIFGRIHLEGRNQGEQTKASGELELDSVFFKDIQLTNVGGPFYFDGNQFFLGENVDAENRVSSFSNPRDYLGQAPASQAIPSPPLPAPPQPTLQNATSATPSNAIPPQPVLPSPSPKITSMPFDPYVESAKNILRTRPATVTPQNDRQITATLFGGTAYCRGTIRIQARNSSYNLQVGLANADLAQVAREMGQSSRSFSDKNGSLGQRNISGILTASANLWGEGKNPDALAGEGIFSLRNAYVYETPMMIKLLQRLSIQEPDDSAFSSSDIRFRIQGKKMLLHSVKFEGSALALEGNGDLKLDGNHAINMILKTKLGGNRSRIPIVGDLLLGAGDQLNEVHIEGPLSDPSVVVITLPGMRSALEQIQGDAE